MRYFNFNNKNFALPENIYALFDPGAPFIYVPEDQWQNVTGTIEEAIKNLL